MSKLHLGWLGCLFFSLCLIQAQETNRVARGKYLVECVAICADCHTEHDWKGDLNREKWLRGAAMEVKPGRLLMPWAPVAPDIAGLPMFTNDAAAIKFFQTGLNTAGKIPRPPMPRLQLTADDAAAVVAYLRALKAGEK